MKTIESLGLHAEGEAYFLADGDALAMPSYLCDHRRAGFSTDLFVAPILVELAMSRHRGRPYVLGRWQAPLFALRHAGTNRDRVRSLKRSLDDRGLLNPGVFFRTRMKFGNVPGFLYNALYRPLMKTLGLLYGLGPVRAVIRGLRRATAVPAPSPAAITLNHAWTCTNCGECNSVCPIFHLGSVRLPQMLTNLAEGPARGKSVDSTGGLLLDLCMRCGNCEEVCQAGIPHLAMYDRMQADVTGKGGYDRERHVGILSAVRSHPAYRDEFLDVRPGAYLRRTPASLTSTVRYVLRRAENTQGPVDTCIHCGACVPVCPTGANREFEAPDARLITTDDTFCVGCATCVEVCPANGENGGATLRVMEAPTVSILRLMGDRLRAARAATGNGSGRSVEPVRPR